MQILTITPDLPALDPLCLYVMFCHLPDSGRHVTSIFQGSSLSLSRSRRQEGEDPGNEVVMLRGTFFMLGGGGQFHPWFKFYLPLFKTC